MGSAVSATATVLMSDICLILRTFFFRTHFIVSNGAKFISFAARNVNIFSIWCGAVPKIARHSVNPIMNRIYMKIGGKQKQTKEYP